MSADDDVRTSGELENEDYIADIVPSTSDSGHNDQSDPLPTSSEVIGALALVQRFCAKVEGCSLACLDSLDHVEKCVLSEAAKLLKQKKIEDYFKHN